MYVYTISTILRIHESLENYLKEDIAILIIVENIAMHNYSQEIISKKSDKIHY